MGEAGRALSAELQRRGILVDFAAEKDKGGPRGSYQPFSSFTAEVLAAPPSTNVLTITIRGARFAGELKNGRMFRTIGTLDGPTRRVLHERRIRIKEEDPNERPAGLPLLAFLAGGLLAAGAVMLRMRHREEA